LNPDEPSLLPETPVFTVEYQAFGVRTANPLLKGSGTMAVLGGGTAFRFTGRARTAFSRQVLEKEFEAAAIRNVTVEGRMVQFRVLDAQGRPLKSPFVLFARDGAGARAIAGQLPARTDGDHAAEAHFRSRLRGLPGATSPWASATNIIIAVNVAVFILMAGFLGAGWFDPVMEPYMRYGANNGAATTDGQWWRLITSMFMHYGLLHLGFNMWALYQSGHLVEKLQGRALYVLCYLGSGLGSGFLSLFVHGDKVWSAGASGAIFGVYGALLGYMLRERQALPGAVVRPLMRSTLTFAGYNLVYGAINPGIDNAAHIGGVLTGLLLGWLTAPPLEAEARARTMGTRLLIACTAIAAVVGVGFAGAPKFDYSVRDELAWRDAVKGFNPEQETRLLQELAQGLQQWQASGDNGPELTRLVERELIPLYQGLLRAIDPLDLAFGRKTERMRRRLDAFGKMKIEAYQHLLLALKSGSKAEFREYETEERKANEAAEALRTKD
jgi:rhomboid protease GluP